MMRSEGKTRKRLRRLLARLHEPEWVDNAGVKLPLRSRLISGHVRSEIIAGNYERKEADILERYVEPADRVLEVGAGIGFLSAFCALRIGSDKVFAYEANPALMEVIAETHRANRVAPTVRNAMLARGEGEREFVVCDDFWASSAHRGASAGRTIRVPQLDLNAELARVRPTLVIVDIEGGEHEFFEYANLEGVRKLCVETHPDVIGNGRITAMLAQLFAAGFVLDCTLFRKNVFYLYK